MWLDTRGGRTIKDVVFDDDNMYILLWYYGTYRRYLIPTDKDILNDYYVNTVKYKTRLACKYDKKKAAR